MYVIHIKSTICLRILYLILLFHQGADFPGLVAERHLPGGIAAHDIRIIPRPQEERTEERAHLKAITSLSLHNCCGRQQGFWL